VILSGVKVYDDLYATVALAVDPHTCAARYTEVEVPKPFAVAFELLSRNDEGRRKVAELGRNMIGRLMLSHPLPLRVRYPGHDTSILLHDM